MPGPAPGAQCQVCDSPHAAQVNADLANPALSNRYVAREYGLNKDSVARHRRDRHPGTPEGPPRVGIDTDGDPDDTTELERLRVIRGQLEASLRERVRSDVARELRQVNGRIAELEGRDRPREVGMQDVAGLPEQVARWFEALERFPEARDAMLEATDPALLERAGVSGP